MEVSHEDLAAMQLIKYFIVEKGYRPVVIQSKRNEIYLERVSDVAVQLIRITPEPITFSDQLNQDESRVKEISKRLKKRSLTMKINAINIYTCDISMKGKRAVPNVKSISVKSIDDLQDALGKIFFDIKDAIYYSDNRPEEYKKLTKEIEEHNKTESQKTVKFIKQPTFPVHRVFMALIAVSYLYTSWFMYEYGLGFRETIIALGATYEPMMLALSQWWRPLTGSFMNLSLFNVFISIFMIGRIGKATESFYGSLKLIVITIVAALVGGYAVSAFNGTIIIFGMGAIFAGWLGALIAFGQENKNLFLNNVKKLKFPIIILVLNLLLYGSAEGIYMLFGLVGGYFTGRMLAWKGKSPGTRAIFDMIVVSALIAAPLYIINYEDKNITSYESINLNDFDGYEGLGQDPIEIGKSVCAWYGIKEADCLWN